VALRGAFGHDHPFSGSGQSIFTMAHGYGTGVPCLTGKAAVQAARAVDGFHHAQRQLFLLQTRPLLNMQLQIGAEIVLISGGKGNTGRIKPHLHHRLRHANTAGIAFFEPVLRPGARQATTAQQSNAETGAFFIAKADNLNGLRQVPSLLMQAIHHFNGGEHAEHPVVSPGVAHGIQMRAK